MKSYTIRFGSKSVLIEGAGTAFTTKFVAAYAAARQRGDTMPPELAELNLREVREFANAVPEAAGSDSPVVTPQYGAQDTSYEEEIVASTAVKAKATGALLIAA